MAAFKQVICHDDMSSITICCCLRLDIRKSFQRNAFLILSVLIMIFGYRIQPGNISLSSFPCYLFGIIMIIFGLVYPHFIETGSFKANP